MADSTEVDVADPSPEAKKIADILQKHRATWMAIPGVSGVGQSIHDGRDCIKIYLSQAVDEDLPRQVDGFEIVSEIVGDFKKQT